MGKLSLILFSVSIIVVVPFQAAISQTDEGAADRTVSVREAADGTYDMGAAGWEDLAQAPGHGTQGISGLTFQGPDLQTIIDDFVERHCSASTCPLPVGTVRFNYGAKLTVGGQYGQTTYGRGFDGAIIITDDGASGGDSEPNDDDRYGLYVEAEVGFMHCKTSYIGPQTLAEALFAAGRAASTELAEGGSSTLSDKALVGISLLLSFKDGDDSCSGLF